MQITYDEEMRLLLNDLKWMDWHEAFTCAITRNPDQQTQSTLVVTGSLYQRLLHDPNVHCETWTVSALLTALLRSLAQGFPMETPGNRYLLAMLEAIRKHGMDKHNTAWTTWDIA